MTMQKTKPKRETEKSVAKLFDKKSDKSAERAFIQKIWKYYNENKRDFAWRETSDPYKILVSEMMLQQTQADRVKIKYEEFTSKFPNIKKLASAHMSDVLKVWKGLGYNRRAYFLKQIAQKITTEYKGVFPRDYSTLLTLPGIGQSTAGAVCAFSFLQKTVFIETNIRTVCIDAFFNTKFYEKEKVSDSEISIKLKSIIDNIPEEKIKDFYYALYDYGTFLKKRGKGSIKISKKDGTRSINSATPEISKHYRKQSKFIGSNRQMRSIILDLIVQKTQTEKEITDHIKKSIRLNEIPFVWSESTTDLIHTIAEDLIKKKQIIAIETKLNTDVKIKSKAKAGATRKSAKTLNIKSKKYPQLSIPQHA